MAETTERIETAFAHCGTCDMPIKVKFKDGEIVQVFAVCGHYKKDGPWVDLDEQVGK